MKEQVETPKESFDELFRSPKFQTLRGRMIRVFARRGCPVPEDLADETITRVLKKLPQIAGSFEGEPMRFFYGVAHRVYLEYARRPRTVPIDESLDVAELPDVEGPQKEVRLACLESCIDDIGAEERNLIREYYRFERGAKIDHRKALAARLGLGMNALRIKAYRIRHRLQRCLHICIQRRGE